MSTPVPETIRLLDASGNLLLDSVATEYEDSFSLEAFGESIQAAETAEPKGTKHFILARVQTWDHKQPDRAFYSYYNAHHLNKLLFQTQIYLDKKLIHRLHVLNPLTNTDIIGNVVYFMVVGKSKKLKDGTIVRIATEDAHVLQQQISRTVDITVDIIPPPTPGTINMVPPSPMVANLPRVEDPVILNRYLHNQNPSNEIGIPADVSNAGWTLTSPVTGNQPDSIVTDHLQTPTKRFSALQSITAAIGNRLSPHNSPSQKTGFLALADQQQQQQQLQDQLNSPSTESNPRSTLRVQTNFVSTGIKAPQSASIVETGSKKYASQLADGQLQAVTILMQPTSTQTTAQTPRDTDSLIKPRPSPLKVPAGQITLHGEPITPVQALSIVPPSARSRRRSLSYMNAITTSGSSGATHEEWQRMYQRDKRLSPTSEKPIKEQEGTYDDVKPFGSTPAHSEGNDDQGVEEYFYDAILLATDNDFLETSRIRAIFKENSVSPTDYQLFEMPPYTGEGGNRNGGPYDAYTNTGFGGGGGIMEMPVCCNACFPSEQELRGRPGWVRALHECKCYLLLILITVTMVILISMAISANHPIPPR